LRRLLCGSLSEKTRPRREPLLIRTYV
jgi:hypothetical protein